MTKGETIADCVTLYPGDCLDMLAELPDCSVDSCVTDPPYHLQSIHQRFAAKGRDETSERYSAGPYGRHATGFMGKKWDGGDIAFRPEVWREVFRVLKPGGHVLAFGGTRTYHRMTCAIEDAGFEIRDCIQWIYGSGFPKSHDISRAIDRAADAERELTRPGVVTRAGYGDDWDTGSSNTRPRYDSPATNDAKQWDGWGTALKPACEPIVLARKPLIGTVAENVLQHGTGALNIDGCRVESDEQWKRDNTRGEAKMYDGWGMAPNIKEGNSAGRWPANVIHDGSEEVVEAFPESGPASAAPRNNGAFKSVAKGYDYPHITHGHADDGGSAARFFYTAKADSDDRLGSKHPTVKPLDLIQYLVRLITPPGGTVLDPFAGTGTTGEAAFREGMKAILIEWEAEYQEDIRRRMKLLLAGPDERAIAAIKAREKDKPIDPGPLFALTIQESK